MNVLLTIAHNIYFNYWTRGILSTWKNGSKCSVLEKSIQHLPMNFCQYLQHWKNCAHNIHQIMFKNVASKVILGIHLK